MKRKIYLLFFIPLLIGCNNQNSSYTGEKMKIEYAENGGFVTIDPEFLYNHAFIDRIDSIYLFGDSGCEACLSLKNSMEAWAKYYHAKIYYLPISSITESNKHYVLDATEGYYVWQDQDIVPTTYFFMQGSVAFKANDSNTIKYLDRYVEVSNPN
ncbi:MAG: hypothetical protein SO176_00815 [Bacilli bacterium]|nr:hypothetical protein [Bacilli bacterium]